MTKWRHVLVLLITAVLSLSIAVPVEDVPETAYDESESLPYASTSVFSVAVTKAVEQAPVVRTRVSLLGCGCLRRLGTQRLDHRTGSPYPISHSLSILDHSLRC
jgi:photosystem II stability/assembly factor-like uncharacterized protein